jgi:two-component system, cell cycle response regulator DivK
MDLTRVLIVDDNAMFIEMASFILSAATYTVESASDARQALVKIALFSPDLILMDVQMPVMDGIELTRKLKADPATKHIVIVAFTAFALKGDAKKLQDAGFNGYIGKPVDVMTLAAEVRFWLEAPSSARASHFVWP